LDFRYSLVGLLIGFLVGLTGMGGASLLTPILILVFKVPPVWAVGTDVTYSTVTKALGSIVHIRPKNVSFKVALWLACVGIFGVLASLTSKRVPELGVRMALVATARYVMNLVLRQSVSMIAVGVVIGAAFTGIVNSLVKDIITPPIGVAMGGLDFTNFFVTLKGPHLATLAEAQKAGAVTLNYGTFLNALINFLVVAIALFLLIRSINRLTTPQTPAEEAAAAPPPPPDTLCSRYRRNYSLRAVALDFCCL